jgi:RNA recognition motif-containing protein
MNIQISNLATNLEDQDVKALFQKFGEVSSAEVQKDVFTGTSRGFAFVEMTDEAAAQKAISDLNQSEFSGKTITVTQAEPRQVHKGSYKVGNGSMSMHQYRRKR